MQRGIGGGEFEPAEERRDKEVTLGGVALLGIGLGLVMLCGLFFSLGFVAGRHAAGPAVATVTQPAPGLPMQPAPGNSLSKPTAASAVSSAQPEIADLQQVSPPEGNQAANPLTSYAPASNPSTADANQLLVRPALPPQGSGGQQAPAASAANTQVQPAIQQQATALMVQVAAVTHVEDARVLVSALRQRGFAVTARELADGMIHVQVGPFTSRTDANAMCQKLLSDGYNAIVQQ